MERSETITLGTLGILDHFRHLPIIIPDGYDNNYRKAQDARNNKREHMTYNFDPDRWYDNELAVLEEHLRTGELDAQEYETAVADLDRRYDEMVDRLDGSYQIPKNEK